jgi:hypothetical protein
VDSKTGNGRPAPPASIRVIRRFNDLEFISQGITVVISRSFLSHTALFYEQKTLSTKVVTDH